MCKMPPFLAKAASACRSSCKGCLSGDDLAAARSDSSCLIWSWYFLSRASCRRQAGFKLMAMHACRA